MTTPNTCYMCDNPATSREHAPPRCLFPKGKDALDRKDYRRNLIVVPSCDLHNADKSSDDEYLMHVLPMSVGVSDVAQFYFTSKVGSLVRHNKKLVAEMSKGAHAVKLHDTETDQWSDGVALSIDLPRIHSVFEMNARAIYFAHHGKKLEGKITLHSNISLVDGQPRLNDLVNQVFVMADSMLTEVGAPVKGDNPEVFTYRIARDGDVELIEMTFYGSSKALVSIQHNQN